MLSVVIDAPSLPAMFACGSVYGDMCWMAVRVGIGAVIPPSCVAVHRPSRRAPAQPSGRPVALMDARCAASPATSVQQRYGRIARSGRARISAGGAAPSSSMSTGAGPSAAEQPWPGPRSACRRRRPAASDAGLSASGRGLRGARPARRRRQGASRSMGASAPIDVVGLGDHGRAGLQQAGWCLPRGDRADGRARRTPRGPARRPCAP